MKIIVKRQKDSETEPRLEVFYYEGNRHISVLSLINNINETNIGNPDFKPIKYECSCEQGLCGACAMVINNRITLGCKAFLDEFVDKKECIFIEPLSKFPIVEDLVVDRSILIRTRCEMKQWLESESKYDSKLQKKQYIAAECLSCGCCLEACPNYTENDLFSGAIGALDMVNIYGKEQLSEHREVLKKEYTNRFYRDCSKVGACQKVCPMGIPTVSMISEANRESIWGIWKFIIKEKKNG